MNYACNCVGPQNGQPLCPCQMRGIIQRDGRWIRPERDLGPVRHKLTDTMKGILCPSSVAQTKADKQP